MKVLILANRFPYPPFRGDKLKIYNLARRLSAHHELHLLTFAEEKSDFDQIEKLAPYFKSIEVLHLPKWRSYWSCLVAVFQRIPFQVAYFRSAKMHRTLRHFLKHNGMDLVYVQHLRMAQYAMNLDHPKILDLPDAFSLYWTRRKNTKRPFFNRLFDPIELRRLKNYEPKMSAFPLNLACSVEDRDYLRMACPGIRIELLRNGVDLETFSFRNHDYGPNNTILFTGNMDYAPNVDAVQYFVEDIFPQILTEVSDARLIIAGQRPVDAVKRLAAENIEITGFVPDLAELYDRSGVVIAPLRFGAGTQNKVLEAMAMGVPVVCTDIGFKGLEIESGEGVIHAPDSREFAQSVISLLQDAAIREKTGQKGLAIAREKFSWDGIALQLEHYWKEVLHRQK